MERDETEALWGHLHWLTVLKEQGSFTAAATRLGVSKAAMSQRIADLERAAGVALVRRTTRSVHLTEAGAMLVESTRGAFKEIAASFAGVRDLAEMPRGVLRVTAPVAFARQQLVQRIPAFLRQYSDVRLELEMSDEMRSLVREGFDLALRHTSAPPETHVAWTLAPTGSVLVASRAYLKRAGVPETPSDLQEHACLYYPRSPHVPTWTLVARTRGRRGAMASKDRATVRISGPFAANNSEALRDAAIAGLGIALLPDFSAQTSLRAGQLCEVLPGWKPESYGDHLYAVRPYETHVPRAVSAFVTFLKEQFSGGFSA